MEIIKNVEELEKSTHNNCQTIEYKFHDKDIDLGIATITGRYPEAGFCVNTISKELIYVIDGNGKLYFEEGVVSFQKGDAMLINANEKYYWDSSYCVISLSCTPAWNEKQYKLVK